MLLHDPCISWKLSSRAVLLWLPYQEGVQSPYKTSLPAMGQQSDLDFTFLKRFRKYRPLPSPAPCNQTQPQPQQTSEHQFHTQNMTQATRHQPTQGSQAERLVPSHKNHSSPTPQHNQHKEKTLDTGFLFLGNRSYLLLLLSPPAVTH